MQLLNNYLCICQPINHRTEPIMNKKLKLAILLFLLGFVGILITLTHYPTPGGSLNISTKVNMLLQLYSSYTISAIIHLLLAVTVGTLLYDKVSFKLPILEGLIDRNKKIETKGILPYGIVGGIIVGILVTLIVIAFHPILPNEPIFLSVDPKAYLPGALLNEGITWEIISRFGYLTFFVWLISKISGKLTPTVYWTAILISGIFFGLAALLPNYFMHGMPTTAKLSYSMIHSIVYATTFGWLYWKKGLETAMIAHIMAFLIITIGRYLFIN